MNRPEARNLVNDLHRIISRLESNPEEAYSAGFQGVMNSLVHAANMERIRQADRALAAYQFGSYRTGFFDVVDAGEWYVAKSNGDLTVQLQRKMTIRDPFPSQDDPSGGIMTCPFLVRFPDDMSGNQIDYARSVSEDFVSQNINSDDVESIEVARKMLESYDFGGDEVISSRIWHRGDPKRPVSSSYCKALYLRSENPDYELAGNHRSSIFEVVFDSAQPLKKVPVLVFAHDGGSRIFGKPIVTSENQASFHPVYRRAVMGLEDRTPEDEEEMPSPEI